MNVEFDFISLQGTGDRTHLANLDDCTYVLTPFFLHSEKVAVQVKGCVNIKLLFFHCN